MDALQNIEALQNITVLQKIEVLQNIKSRSTSFIRRSFLYDRSEKRLDQVARRKMTRRYLPVFGVRGMAFFHTTGASCRKSAARLYIDGAGYLPFDHFGWHSSVF